MVEDSIQHELDALRRLVMEMSSSNVSQTPADILNKVEHIIAQLRLEFKDASRAQYELLASAGIGRHEKALLRIEAVEKANKLFEDNLQRVPTQLDREAGRITVLFDEKLLATRNLSNERLDGVNSKIKSIQNYQNVTRENSSSFAEAMRENAKEAISAAFSAAKEVSNNQRTVFEQQIAKTEASITKEIDGLKSQITAVKDGLQSNISNLTGRIDRGEGTITGARQSVSDKHGDTGNTIGIIGGAASVLMLLAFVFFNYATSRDNRPNTAITLEPTASQSTAIERSRVINDKLDLLSRQLQNSLPTPLNNRN